MVNKALYPVKCIEWCIWTHFTQDWLHITKHFLVNSKLQHVKIVVSLDGWLWAVSCLIAEKLHIRCLAEMHVIDISSPLQIVGVENGCVSYSPNICIPANWIPRHIILKIFLYNLQCLMSKHL